MPNSTFWDWRWCKIARRQHIKQTLQRLRDSDNLFLNDSITLAEVERTNAEMKEGSVKSTHSAGSGSISYSGVLQAQTTRTRSVAAPNGITTTTTTQTSKTVMAVMETRFQNIEEEQKSLKHRLSNVETRTMTTDDNIRIMMAHWKINPTPMKRKHIEGAEDEENDSAAGNAILPVTTPQGQGAQYF